MASRGKVPRKVVKYKKMEDTEVIDMYKKRTAGVSAMMEYDASKSSDHKTLM